LIGNDEKVARRIPDPKHPTKRNTLTARDARLRSSLHDPQQTGRRHAGAGRACGGNHGSVSSADRLEIERQEENAAG
jgi:hypothetical protein